VVCEPLLTNTDKTLRCDTKLTGRQKLDGGGGDLPTVSPEFSQIQDKINWRNVGGRSIIEFVREGNDSDVRKNA
jgi:hypothetical protein